MSLPNPSTEQKKLPEITAEAKQVIDSWKSGLATLFQQIAREKGQMIGKERIQGSMMGTDAKSSGPPRLTLEEWFCQAAMQPRPANQSLDSFVLPDPKQLEELEQQYLSQQQTALKRVPRQSKSIPLLDVYDSDRVYLNPGAQYDPERFALPGVPWNVLSPADQQRVREARKQGLSHYYSGGVEGQTRIGDARTGGADPPDVIYRVPDSMVPKVPVDLRQWKPPSNVVDQSGQPQWIPSETIADYEAQIRQQATDSQPGLQEDSTEGKTDVQLRQTQKPEYAYHIQAVLPPIQLTQVSPELAKLLPPQSSEQKMTQQYWDQTTPQPAFDPRPPPQPVSKLPFQFYYQQPTSSSLPMTITRNGGKAKKSKIITFQRKSDSLIQLTKSGLREALRDLKQKNTIVLSSKKPIRILIEYPLQNAVLLTFTCPSGQCTKGELLTRIARAYQSIYAEERKTSTLKEETLKQRSQGKSSLINRAPTDGTYGIWGHVLSDLGIHSMEYDSEKRWWTLEIDS